MVRGHGAGFRGRRGDRLFAPLPAPLPRWRSSTAVQTARDIHAPTARSSASGGMRSATRSITSCTTSRQNDSSRRLAVRASTNAASNHCS
jgi:hypothetical protein